MFLKVTGEHVGLFLLWSFSKASGKAELSCQSHRVSLSIDINKCFVLQGNFEAGYFRCRNQPKVQVLDSLTSAQRASCFGWDVQAIVFNVAQLALCPPESNCVLMCGASYIVSGIPVAAARMQVVEKLNLLESSNGTVLHSEIVGAIKMKVWMCVPTVGTTVVVCLSRHHYPLECAWVCRQ